MTQRLQQSIKLLQMPAAELQEFVFAEIQDNPLLSVAEPGEGGAEETAESAPTEQESEPENDDGSEERGLDVEEESWWGEEQATSSISDEGGYSATEAIEQRHSENLSLRDHLRAQLVTLVYEAADRLIAEALIDLLDDSGYLTESTVSIEKALGAHPAAIEGVLYRLQRADPPGVFARSLKECLSLQLDDRGQLDAKMETFLEHLDLIGSGDLITLRQRTGLDERGIRETLQLIRTLDPKPGAKFESEPVVTMIPDVLVKKTNGIWRAELNPDALPKVLLNRHYHHELSGKMRGKDERKFLSEKFASASWLVKALEQRATNTLKVATQIIAWQKDFLDRGIVYLKPMRLADIALEAGVHESTVSRIASGKTMATPRGLFEIRYFFTTAVGGEDGGDALSSRSIMHEIGRLIGKEGDAVLSDDTLARMLKEKGIDVARRTVVKYRGILGIPSSVDRRRQKLGVR